jgi:inhibitor of cysteine peptidase
MAEAFAVGSRACEPGTRRRIVLMKRVLRGPLLAGVAMAVIATIAGCASQPVAPKATNPEPAAPIQLTAKDSGSTQIMEVGQELDVTLKANPTTGYQWAVDGLIPTQLTMPGQPKFTAASSAIGSGGKQVWTLVAKYAGSGTLKLKYWRSFEATTPPIETFEVNVDVK